MYKVLLLVAYILYEVYQAVLVKLNDKAAKWPLPENVRDVYNEEEYKKWLNYRNDNKKLNMYKTFADGVVTVCFIIFDVYARIFEGLNVNTVAKYFLLALIVEAVLAVVGIPFGYYSTFVIEEKYGMNKSTKKTFVADIFKNYIMEIIVLGIFVSVIGLLFTWLGNVGVVLAIVCIMLIITLLQMFPLAIARVFNKFTPLEDGELKEKLMALCEKYDMQVKRISVMDASRRTTRANAFCAGIGKKKDIALHDNLVNRYTTDQIVAVFAHEFAHAKYKHTLSLIATNGLGISLQILFIGILLNIPSFFTAFGFSDINFYFAFVMAGILFWPVSELGKWLSSSVGRKCEYQADAFAAREGYGDELISSLKQLSKESLSNLNPHPFIVALEYNHPTISQRATAVEKIKAENKKAE